MADGNYPDRYPDDPGACAGCGRLPEQVEALAGPSTGPVVCVDCVDRARAGLRAMPGVCAACERPGAGPRGAGRVGGSGMVLCAACLDGLAAAMAEPD